MYHKSLTTILQFQNFDGQFVRRLADGDSAAGEHFGVYFNTVLQLKLRMRLRSAELIEDIKQETLLRVLAIVRDEGVRYPERLGALVNAVCNNVVREFCRSDSRHEPWDDHVDEPADSTVDLDTPLVNRDRKRQIAGILWALNQRDREILQAVFLDEVDKEEVCRRFDVDAAYLRVLVHRAKAHFRKAYGGEG